MHTGLHYLVSYSFFTMEFLDIRSEPANKDVSKDDFKWLTLYTVSFWKWYKRGAFFVKRKNDYSQKNWLSM